MWLRVGIERSGTGTTLTSTATRLPDVFTDPVSGRKISLLDYKKRNMRLSWLLALATAGILVALAYALSQVVDVASTAFFVGSALAVGGVQGFVGFYLSDKIALAAAGAQKATAEQHRYLVNVTEAVAIGAGVPTPEVYVIDSPAPNAFATGRDPRHSSIAVTRGLIELLDRQELEGVVAHEMAHVRNYDIRFMSMLVATVGAVVVLRDLVLRWMRFGGGGSSRRRSSSGGGGGGSGGGGQAVLFLVLVVLLVLGPVLATLLRLAVSRRREFLADAAAAYITRNPEGLARALEKIRDYRGPRLEVSEGVRHMFIANPLSGDDLSSLFSTHPPIQERINRLRRM
jgi:heat shock protein HtpX